MQDEPQEELPEQLPAPKQQQQKVRDIRRKDGNQGGNHGQQNTPELKALGKALELGDRLEEILEGITTNRDALAVLAKAIHDGEKRRDEQLTKALETIMEEHDLAQKAFRALAVNPKNTERVRKTAESLTGESALAGSVHGSGIRWFLLVVVAVVVVFGALVVLC